MRKYIKTIINKDGVKYTETVINDNGQRKIIKVQELISKKYCYIWRRIGEPDLLLKTAYQDKPTVLNLDLNIMKEVY